MTDSSREYVIYATDNCTFCSQAKALLEYYNAKYELIYDKSPDWDTYPCVYVLTNDGLTLIGGFNELALYSYENGL